MRRDREVGPDMAGALVTVKLTLKLAVIPLLPDTVTVAVYGLALNVRPLLGLTVKVVEAPAAIPVIEVAESVK